MLRRIMEGIYVVGWIANVGAAGLYYWPLSRSFYDWWSYVIFQMIYSIFWPLVAVVQLVSIVFTAR